MYDDVKATVVGFLTIAFCLMLCHSPLEVLAGIGALLVVGLFTYSCLALCWLVGAIVLSISEKVWGEEE